MWTFLDGSQAVKQNGKFPPAASIYPGSRSGSTLALNPISEHLYLYGGEGLGKSGVSCRFQGLTSQFTHLFSSLPERLLEV